MFRFGWRFTRLLTHVLTGLLFAVVLWPVLGNRLRRGLECWFARRLMRILKVEVRWSRDPDSPSLADSLLSSRSDNPLTSEHYSPKAEPAEGRDTSKACLIYSNHVSWLDIFAFNSICPVTFIAKAEIADWPLAGTLATRSGTLYIERGKRHAVRDVIHKAIKVIEGGRHVVVFPEGTTGPGDRPLKFHSNFVQAAAGANCQLWPVSLQYQTPDGRWSTDPAYLGEQSLWENIQILLKSPDGYVAHLHFHAPLEVTGQTRQALSEQAHALITQRLDQGLARHAA